MTNKYLNYKKAIKQKYNAICFDIDGTITENNSKNVSEKFFPYLANLLIKRIPVVFITGRGETGLGLLKNEIIPVLKQQYNVNDELFDRLYALTNDGARLFSSSKTAIFDKTEYTVSQENIIKLAELNEEIKKIIEESSLIDYCDLKYSYDSITGNILNIRLIIKNDKASIIELITNTLKQLISSNYSNNINITTGLYENNKVLQIGTTIKGNAMKIVEHIIGIPENSMLRIGDCGDENGNDFSMLDCSQGFSVNKCSIKEDACFPVYDEFGNILTGIEATISLLDKVKLLPAICLEHATQSEYVKAYSSVEKKINNGRKRYIKKYDDIINNVFGEYDGINSIIDSKTGSVRIKMYDWELIDENNPLKRFWSKSIDNRYNYILKDDDSILLRGSKTYYYFLAHRETIINGDTNKEEDITSKSLVSEWLYNYKNFFEESVQVISSMTENLNNIYNKKMILGIIDNARNYLLVILNNKIKNNFGEETVFVNLENILDCVDINDVYKLLLKVEKIMSEICFDSNYNIKNNEISELLFYLNELSYQELIKFEDSEEKHNYSKDFRAYREIDNFIENFITVDLSINKYIKESVKTIGVCGLSYGGIELPILYKVVENNISDVSVLKFSNTTSGYSKKQSVELRFFDVNKSDGINMIGIDSNKNYMLLDDNLLTGKSMQIALSIMNDIGVSVNGITIVRYPSVNRISQMFLPNHGAVDYKLFFNYITGLCFPSPYSYKDPHSRHIYEDSLGVFDINRKKILECLAKNNDYNVNSEVNKLIKKKSI